MKIRQSVIKRLQNSDPNRLHALLMLALDCSQSTVRAYINNNDDNLTKAAALQVIREELKLEDHQILENFKEPTKIQS